MPPLTESRALPSAHGRQVGVYDELEVYGTTRQLSWSPTATWLLGELWKAHARFVAALPPPSVRGSPLTLAFH